MSDQAAGSNNWRAGAKTVVTVSKGDYEVSFTIWSAQIYDDDLEQIRMFVHHMHGVIGYDQRQGDRHPVEEKP